MAKIVECVPNFSEGRNELVIKEIETAITSVQGCLLLNVDIGDSTNRTIFTFVGEPEAVLQGALAAARVAYNLINMQKHRGLHPRIGAMDVCPFIPISNISLDECVELSVNFAKMLCQELNVSIYLYELSQPKDYRRELSVIRKGEYENLKLKLKDPKMQPDFGPSEFNPTFGATCVGARSFLIAYTINLTAFEEQSDRIAKKLMSLPNFKCGKIASWFIRENNMAQLAINLTDYKTTNIHDAFIECETLIKKDFDNVCIKSTEVVGMIPLDAILMAADHFIENENLGLFNVQQKIDLVTKRLKIVQPGSNIRQKIIEFIIDERLRSHLSDQ